MIFSHITLLIRPRMHSDQHIIFPANRLFKKKPFTFTGCHFFCVDVISDNVHSDISLVFHVTNYLLLVSRKQPHFKDITCYAYFSSCGVCLCIPPRL